MVINIEKEYQVIFSINPEEYKMFKKPDILYRLTMLIRKSKPNHIKPFMGFKAKVFLEYKNKIIGEANCFQIKEWEWQGFYMISDYDIYNSKFSICNYPYVEIKEFGEEKSLYGYELFDIKIYEKEKKLKRFIKKEFLKEKEND